MENAGTWLDLLGWVGTTITLIGTWFLARLRFRLGWTVRTCGDLLWLWWAWEIGYPSLVLAELAFLMLDGFGLYRSIQVEAARPRSDSTSGQQTGPSAPSAE